MGSDKIYRVSLTNKAKALIRKEFSISGVPADWLREIYIMTRSGNRCTKTCKAFAESYGLPTSDGTRLMNKLRDAGCVRFVDREGGDSKHKPGKWILNKRIVKIFADTDREFYRSLKNHYEDKGKAIPESVIRLLQNMDTF
jgi:hypothetical protein